MPTVEAITAAIAELPHRADRSNPGMAVTSKRGRMGRSDQAATSDAGRLDALARSRWRNTKPVGRVLYDTPHNRRLLGLLPRLPEAVQRLRYAQLRVVPG